MIRQRRPTPIPMPRTFDALSRYNDEVSHGVLHDPRYVARMADLQREYDVWVDRATRRLTTPN